jgi:hypothetical protein
MWYKKAEDYKKMEDWFKKRTQKHIDLVAKYCKKINDYDGKRFNGILERGKVHDQSKFKDPEVEPYVYISWQYKCKDDGKEFECPDGMDEKMSKATEYHVKNNSHHPECHSEKEVGLISRKDRDKPPKEIIDATKMPDLDVAECVADWCSMSEERGNTPKSWADKNVNVRWKFNKDQVDLIYELIENIWE